MLDININELSKFGLNLRPERGELINTETLFPVRTIFSDTVPEDVNLYIKFHLKRNEYNIDNRRPATIGYNCYDLSETEDIWTTKEAIDFIHKNKIKLGFDHLFSVKKDITEELLIMIGFEKSVHNSKLFRHKVSLVDVYFSPVDCYDNKTNKVLNTIEDVVNLICEKQREAGQVEKAEEIKKSLFL